MTHPVEHPSNYERRDISVKGVALFALIFILFLLISLTWLNDWFIKTKEDMYKEMVLQPQNQELLKLRAREDSLLTSYGKADTTGVAYRIPIDSAMALIVAEKGSDIKKK